MQIKLTGRTAIVTGGSRGLGLATAAKLSECGAEVAIVARRADVLEQARAEIATKGGGRVMGFACDVSKPADIQAAFGKIMENFGKVDILVNNAGQSKTGQFDTLNDADWQGDLDLKLFGAIRWSRLVWAQMKERRWGRIINVLSIQAKSQGGGSAPTSVSRAAGMALTKVMAHDGAKHNILVNAMLVGAIMSDQMRNRAKRENKPLEEITKVLGAAVPLGRVGEAEEFANVAAFYASDLASYLAGTALNIDGGKSNVP